MRTPILRPSTAAQHGDIERRVAAIEQAIARLSAPVQQRPVSTTNMVKQTAHGLASGSVIRHSGTAWVKSKADTAANAVVGGIVLAALSPDVFVMATSGYVAGLSGLTAGSAHYLDATTAGALTTTAPAIAVPIVLADSAASGVLLSLWAGGSGGTAPTEDGTVFCSNSAGTAGEWTMNVDVGRNATGKAGKIQIISPDAGGVAAEIDAALVTAASKMLTIREEDYCSSGVAMKRLVLASAPY